MTEGRRPKNLRHTGMTEGRDRPPRATGMSEGGVFSERLVCRRLLHGRGSAAGGFESLFILKMKADSDFCDDEHEVGTGLNESQTSALSVVSSIRTGTTNSASSATSALYLDGLRKL